MLVAKANLFTINPKNLKNMLNKNTLNNYPFFLIFSLMVNKVLLAGTRKLLVEITLGNSLYMLDQLGKEH